MLAALQMKLGDNHYQSYIHPYEQALSETEQMITLCGVTDEFAYNEAYNLIAIYTSSPNNSAVFQKAATNILFMDSKVMLQPLDDWAIAVAKRRYEYEQVINKNEDFFKDYNKGLNDRDVRHYLEIRQDDKNFSPFIKHATEEAVFEKNRFLRTIMFEMNGDPRFLSEPVALQKYMSHHICGPGIF